MTSPFLLIFLLLLLFILLLILCRLIYTQFIQPGAVYFPTPPSTVEKMLDLAQVNPKDTIIDLGSGDGRILIAAARRQAHAIGYEIDPILARHSRQLITKANLSHLASVKCSSLWRADFNQATVITLYLFPRYMSRLQKILEKKLTRPILLVSHNYQFPHKKYIKKKDNTYLYKFNPL